MLLKLFRLILKIKKRQSYLKGYMSALKFMENYILHNTNNPRDIELYKIIRANIERTTDQLIRDYKEEDL